MKFSLLSMLLLLSSIGFSQRINNTNDGNKNQVPLNLYKPLTEKDDEESSAAALLHVKTKWYKQMHQKNADYFAVKKAYDNYFKKHPLEGSAPKEYGLSWLKTKIFYLDSRGRVQTAPTINYNKLPNAVRAVAPTVTDTISGDWRMTGPRNSVWVTNVSQCGLGNYGGYANCVRIDPTNVNKLFISFIQGGLWTSADNGVAWKLSDANMPAEAYYDIDVCKANNNIVYAISASAVIKSIDGGFSWSVTGLNKTNFAGTAYDLAVSPTDANVVLARWGGNIYRTTNGGTTWTVIKTGLKDFGIMDSNSNSEVLDWDNNNNNIVYFTDRGDNQNFVDVYKSTNAGASFTLFKTLTIPSGATGTVTGWSKICTATNNTTSVYVLLGTGTNEYSHTAVQMYKLDVATGNVLITRTNMVLGVDASYGSTTFLHHGDIAMDINNDNKIIYGGYSNKTVQYSSNNGVSFTVSPDNIHADIRGMYMMNGKIILASDGAAYLSTNSGASYTVVSNSISNHELWGFGSAFKSDLLVAGTNHGPLMIRDYEAPGGWYHIIGADQGNSDINPLDSVTVYSQGYDSYHVIRTGIKSFTNNSQQIDPGGIYNYFNQMEFHPNLYKTLITHHGGNYPSGNANLATWKNSLIRSDDNGLTLKVVYTFADVLFREKICMTNPNVIYAVVGLTNNTLMKSTNGGASWTTITPPTSITTTGVRNISDIAVSDVNPNEIWVSYSGVQNTCQVLHSTDGGGTFTNMTTSVLTSNPITKMIFQRGTNGGVYVGNTSGVYYRNNSMTNWVKLGNGLPQVDIRFMFINYNRGKLLIGTSRGGWDHNLYETTAPKAQISASSNKVSCGGKIQFKDYSVVRNASASWSWSFPGGTPSTSTSENPTVTYNNVTAGASYNVSLTVTDALGTNTQTLTNFIQAQNACVTCTTAFEPNETQTAAKAISAGANVSAALNTATDVDYYKITTSGTTDNKFDLTGPAGIDYDLYVYNSAGTQIGAGENATATETISLTAQPAGTYYIKVNGYGDFSNTCYTLKATVTNLALTLTNKKVLNRSSGKALDNLNSSTSDNTPVGQWPFVAGSNNQLWQFVNLTNGYYKIQNNASGKVLDNPGFSTANGTGIVQYGYVGGDNQQWKVEDLGTGYFKITNKTSGKALENPGSSTTDGTQMTQSTYVGGANQQWQIVDVAAARLANVNQTPISQNNSIDGRLKIYPNPAVDVLNIENITLGATTASLKIIDINSNVVFSRTLNKNKEVIDVSKLPNGIYMLETYDGKNIRTFKFNKQ